MRGMVRAGLLMASAVACTIAAGSCRRVQPLDVSSIDPRKMATMETKNVATYITDSGITQYKIVSPIWYVFDEADTPYWHFPQGLYLQKYDRGMKVIATVAADSARYFKNQRLWRLDGHVEMHKAPRDLFLTQQLFWDERKGKIYSDSFIHVETDTRILEGHGFISDQNLTVYRVLNPTGIFPVPQGDQPAASQPQGPLIPPPSSPNLPPDTLTR